METGKSKAMNRFIPAGSVYTYKVEDRSMDIENLTKLINEQGIAFNESYKGFGRFEILNVKETIDE